METVLLESILLILLVLCGQTTISFNIEWENGLDQFTAALVLAPLDVLIL